MKFLGIITIILIACAFICGMWMKANPGQGSIAFHSAISIAAMGFAALTIILYMTRK